MRCQKLEGKNPLINKCKFAVTIFIQIILNVSHTYLPTVWFVLKIQRDTSAESEQPVSAIAFSHSEPKKSGFSKRLLFTRQLHVVFHIQIIHLLALPAIHSTKCLVFHSIAGMRVRQIVDSGQRLEFCRTPKALWLRDCLLDFVLF